MSFPEEKKEKINIFGVELPFYYNKKNGWRCIGKKRTLYDDICDFCGRTLRIGRDDDGKTFKYCPLCMIKK